MSSSRATPPSASGWKLRRSPAIARDFAQHLAHSLQIPRAQARRIAGDDLGEPIVIAAKALTMPRDVVYRILLFVNTTVGHSVERVHALAALYDEMPMQSRRTHGRDLAGAAAARPGRRETPAAARGTTRPASAPAPRPRRYAARQRRSGRRTPRRFLTHDIEKIAAGGILDLDNPDVGIEFHLARKLGFDRRIRRRLLGEACRE